MLNWAVVRLLSLTLKDNKNSDGHHDNEQQCHENHDFRCNCGTNSGIEVIRIPERPNAITVCITVKAIGNAVSVHVTEMLRIEGEGINCIDNAVVVVIVVLKVWKAIIIEIRVARS